MSNVPDDAIVRRIVKIVKCDCEFDHPQPSTEMPAGLTHGIQQKFSQLDTHRFKLFKV
jgi:hypothetical protein